MKKIFINLGLSIFLISSCTAPESIEPDVSDPPVDSSSTTGGSYFAKFSFMSNNYNFNYTRDNAQFASVFENQIGGFAAPNPPFVMFPLFEFTFRFEDRPSEADVLALSGKKLPTTLYEGIRPNTSFLLNSTAETYLLYDTLDISNFYIDISEVTKVDTGFTGLRRVDIYLMKATGRVLLEAYGDETPRILDNIQINMLVTRVRE